MIKTFTLSAAATCALLFTSGYANGLVSHYQPNDSRIQSTPAAIPGMTYINKLYTHGQFSWAVGTNTTSPTDYPTDIAFNNGIDTHWINSGVITPTDGGKVTIHAVIPAAPDNAQSSSAWALLSTYETDSKHPYLTNYIYYMANTKNSPAWHEMASYKEAYNTSFNHSLVWASNDYLWMALPDQVVLAYQGKILASYATSLSNADSMYASKSLSATQPGTAYAVGGTSTQPLLLTFNYDPATQKITTQSQVPPQYDGQLVHYKWFSFMDNTYVAMGITDADQYIVAYGKTLTDLKTIAFPTGEHPLFTTNIVAEPYLWAYSNVQQDDKIPGSYINLTQTAPKWINFSLPSSLNPNPGGSVILSILPVQPGIAWVTNANIINIIKTKFSGATYKLNATSGSPEVSPLTANPNLTSIEGLYPLGVDSA